MLWIAIFGTAKQLEKAQEVIEPLRGELLLVEP